MTTIPRLLVFSPYQLWTIHTIYEGTIAKACRAGGQRSSTSSAMAYYPNAINTGTRKSIPHALLTFASVARMQPRPA